MRRRYRVLALVLVLILQSMLVSCEKKGSLMEQANNKELTIIEDKYRNFYEIFLYSYYDSNKDGIGDINGLIEKLDYINDGNPKTDSDMGFTGIWLMPIMPSPTYHKYDVMDYYNISEEYGTLDDFSNLVEQCHTRGIHVIIDLIMNHTSCQHQWFVQACDYLQKLGNGEPSKEDCPYYDYYNFTKVKVNDTYYNIEGTDWYYEGNFCKEMPDLNLASNEVREEFSKITDFWFDLGVDGFRLDAVGEYYSGDITKNTEILTWFNSMVKAKNPEAYLVGEAWTSMEEYKQYYSSQVDSMFNFEFADKNGIIANTVIKGAGKDASTYGHSLVDVQGFSEYNKNYIDAPFYTNHDTGRSAGYYSGDYAMERTKMAGALNLFMSGSAFVYYGEELGMKGSGIDENKRAPMQWSSQSDSEGMCKGPAGMKDIKMKYGSLEDQQSDPLSIYNFYKQAIKLRNIYPEIARGTVTFMEELSDENVCVITKEYNGNEIMIIFNISEDKCSIDLSNYKSTNRDRKIGGMLLTGETSVQYKNDCVAMPAYSVVILK